jgi:hypothetical protein
MTSLGMVCIHVMIFWREVQTEFKWQKEVGSVSRSSNARSSLPLHEEENSLRSYAPYVRSLTE